MKKIKWERTIRHVVRQGRFTEEQAEKIVDSAVNISKVCHVNFVNVLRNLIQISLAGCNYSNIQLLADKIFEDVSLKRISNKKQ